VKKRADIVSRHCSLSAGISCSRGLYDGLGTSHYSQTHRYSTKVSLNQVIATVYLVLMLLVCHTNN